jgi:hypothetical protein
MPYVAIIGGFYDLDAVTANSAKARAVELGKALAENGFGLVVYFSDDMSLETHVVHGYVQELATSERSRCIRIRFAESQRGQVYFPEQQNYGELFDAKLFAGPDWEAPFYGSLVAADQVDAALLMAGGRSTLIAGQVAVARALPVLAIDEFGGAAGRIWSTLSPRFTDYPSSASHSLQQSVAWLRERCRIAADERRESVRREQLCVTLMRRRQTGVWLSAVFIALLTVFFLGSAYTPAPYLWPFLTISGLVFAGATGALSRSLIWGGLETTPGVSFLLGSIAGFVVGLAYLIPQFIGAP